MVDGVDQLRPELVRGAPARLLLAGLCLLLGGGCGGPAASGAPPPLAHAFGSPWQVAEAVLGALAADDGETLTALALSETEFRTVVWPELPASRPERGVPFDYAWGDLHQKSGNALRRLLARAAGVRYELLDVAFDGESMRYDTFTVHRESRLRVRAPDGAEVDLRLFGSVLERGGEYKLFSYVVD